MDMSGERRIPAPRETVWNALNDPAVLKASIPGCDSLEKTGDNDMKASASVKIGPIAARFAGRVTLSEIDPPNGYTISGEGQGGVAGFAKGGAHVRLTEEGAAATLLAYTVNAQVGGKIAQLGARLIDASAKQMADAFFDRFTAHLTRETEAPATGVPVGAEAGSPAAVVQGAAPSLGILSMIPREPFGLPLVAWIGGVAYLLILVLVLGSSL